MRPLKRLQASATKTSAEAVSEAPTREISRSSRKGRRKRRGRGPASLAPWGAALLLGLVAFALRAVNLGRSWDIFVDEIIYFRISQSVARGQGVEFLGNDFYLHPPGFFYLQAAYMKVFGGISPSTGTELIAQIYDARYLNVVLAAASAAVIFFIGRRLAGWPAGLASAGIFALEPFAMKMNSRNYLDTSAMFWVLLGYWVVLSGISGDRRLSTPRAVLAGLLFGLAILTKDLTVLVTLLPLAGCFVLGWGVPRAKAALAAAVAAICYLPYPITIYAIGDWGDFYEQKFSGVRRLAGIIHETGFNQEDSPSFVSTVLAHLDTFATTYSLFAAGTLSVAVLCFSRLDRSPRMRTFVLWAGASYAMLGFIVLQGALEEQLFYYLLIPSILATAVAGTLLLGRGTASGFLSGGRRDAAVSATAIVCAAFLCWTAYVWADVHFTADNGNERVISYIEEELPEDATVGTTSDIQQFLLGADETVRYSSVAQMREDNVRYVIISSYLVDQGYGDAGPEFHRQVREQGELIYGFEGESFWHTGLYRLDEGEGA